MSCVTVDKVSLNGWLVVGDDGDILLISDSLFGILLEVSNIVFALVSGVSGVTTDDESFDVSMISLVAVGDSEELDAEQP